MRSFFIVLGIIVFITACSSSEKKNGETVDNTYYIEFSADNDSLKNTLVNFIDGKTTFHKNNKLEIVPMTFLIDPMPDIHYFKYGNDLKDVKKGTQKITLTVTGNMSTDSTFYSMPKYRYDGNKWEKFSDVGSIPARLDPSFKKRPRFKYDELAKTIRDNLFQSTYSN
jgi:hypothetical protein